MADTSIATQTTLRDVRLALNELASNLDYHVNASLAKAHGITALNFGVPVYDGAGNDVQYYRDSNGDIVGRYQLRFTVGNTVYYAPAKTTSLTGQDTTGSLTQADVDALLSKVEKSAWVTIFTEGLVDEINAVRDGILLPHTLMGHWEAHAIPLAYPLDTFDHQGHRVGRYRMVFQVAGIKYEIPCDTALGGPPKTPKINPKYPTVQFLGQINGNFSIQGSTIYMHVEAGEAWPNSVDITYQITGTKPANYTWQYSFDNSTWSDFITGTPVPGQGSGNGALTLTTANGGTVLPSGSHTANFAIQSAGGDDGNTWYIRCIFSNAGGSATSASVLVDMRDSADKFLCTLAAERGYVDKNVLAADYAHARTLPGTVRDGYRLWAKPTSRFLSSHPVLLRALAPFIRAWAVHSAHKAGLLKKSTGLGKVVYGIGYVVSNGLGWLWHQLRSKD